MRELREKYVEMRAMRLEDARDDAEDPRPRMRALAARFPGALREIDELPLAAIERRIDELGSVIEGAIPPPRWARALADYHGWMRAVLALRRHVGRAREVDAAMAWIERAYRPRPDEPTHEALSLVVERVLRPPEGRLNRSVLAILADRYGTSALELEAELFPFARSARSSRAMPGRR